MTSSITGTVKLSLYRCFSRPLVTSASVWEIGPYFDVEYKTSEPELYVVIGPSDFLPFIYQITGITIKAGATGARASWDSKNDNYPVSDLILKLIFSKTAPKCTQIHNFQIKMAKKILWKGCAFKRHFLPVDYGYFSQPVCLSSTRRPRKMQVQICRNGKHRYRKGKSNFNAD